MKKFLGLLSIVLMFASCNMSNSSSTDLDKTYTYVQNDMFAEVPVSAPVYSTYRVVYDKETLVMYAVSDGAYCRGTFTMLVNADGTPKLYKK